MHVLVSAAKLTDPNRDGNRGYSWFGTNANDAVMALTLAQCYQQNRHTVALCS